MPRASIFTHSFVERIGQHPSNQPAVETFVGGDKPYDPLDNWYNGIFDRGTVGRNQTLDLKYASVSF